MATQQILWALEDAAYRSAHRFRDWPVMAISRYISTGRSSRDFDQALAKANPDKLLRHMLAGDSMTDDAMMGRCKAYLHRYCGFKF